jgi:predicted acetyltransferase
VVANVSVNLLEFIINGEKKSAIQIVTVMTYSNYRNRGLSASLMNKVLEEYENKSDFIYLFANQNVLEFYPKFGFKSVNEYQFSLEYSPNQSDLIGIRKLDGKNIDDLNFIYQVFIRKRACFQTFWYTKYSRTSPCFIVYMSFTMIFTT